MSWDKFDEYQTALFSFWENMSIRNIVIFSLLFIVLVSGGLGWYQAYQNGIPVEYRIVALVGGFSMVILVVILVWRFAVVSPKQTVPQAETSAQAACQEKSQQV